jgi:hypothetical protein
MLGKGGKGGRGGYGDQFRDQWTLQQLDEGIAHVLVRA